MPTRCRSPRERRRTSRSASASQSRLASHRRAVGLRADFVAEDIACRQYSVQRRAGEGVDPAIGQQGTLTRQGISRERVNVAPAEPNRARVDRTRSGDRGKQGRLAGPIGSQHRPTLARRDRHAERIDEHALRCPQRDANEFQQPAFHQRRPRNQRNTGTPISAVSTPTGSCSGAKAVRATVSATTTSVPPSSIEAGSTTR